MALPASAATVDGTAGDDVLVGTHQGDRIHGFGGYDMIEARLGGPGVGRSGRRRDPPGTEPLLEGPRGDNGFGNAGDDVVVGGPAFDVVVGNGGDDTLRTAPLSALLEEEPARSSTEAVNAGLTPGRPTFVGGT